MKNLKKFETEEERISFTENYKYVSYTEETSKVNIHKETFFCRLIQNDRSVIEIEGSGVLTTGMTSPYRDTTVAAVIGNLCTSIGYDAFYQWHNLQSITIGENVTSIGS